MGEARNATLGTARSAHQIRLHLWSDLPAGRQGSRSRPAVLQHRHHELAPGGDLIERRTRRSRRFTHGPGWLASDAEARAANQHLDRRNPLEMPRAQPAGKHLAVHARQLAIEPGVRLLRRDRRSLLSRLEQARRTALVDKNTLPSSIFATIIIGTDRCSLEGLSDLLGCSTS